ncbi:uncharacterized protein LOC135205675 [Macrobrachium nipponense]|uniref:uncharacterized protein LOC135205675 n=1 Tax=Macrobrachium nipponense TaxID=159736 RepID=UPI0030C87E55
MGPEGFPHNGPPGPLDHQNQMNRIPPCTGPEGFPHNGPPGPLDHQNQMNRIPPSMGPEGFPHNGPPGPLDQQNQVNWIPPGMGPEACPHNGPPGPLDHQNQMNRIPPSMGPEAFPHNGPPGPLDHQNQMNRIPPGMGPEAFPHNGPPGPLDHQNQMNRIPPSMGPEAFPYSTVPIGYREILINPQFPAVPTQPLPHIAAPQRVTAIQGAIAHPEPTQQGIAHQGVQSQDPCIAGCTAPVTPTKAAGSVPTSLPSVSVTPVSEVSAAVPSVTPVAKVSAAVPSVTPVSGVSTAVASVTPVSKVSAAVPSVTPVSEVSAAVPSVTPVAKVSAAVPSVTPVSGVSTAVPSVTKVSVAVPSVTPVSKVSAAVPSVTPAYEASPAVAGSCTIQAPPRLKTVMKGHLVVQDMETDMNESQARTLLQEFGELGEMKWPLNQKDKPARFLMINYMQRKHAERAERILNYLKVFGGNSQVKLVGGDPKGRASDLESEDLELLLNIHEVLNRIKKENLKNNVQEIPLPTQTSHNTPEPVMADNVKPLLAPVTPGLTIVVSNFTDIVPVKDVNEMFVELGACGQGVLIQNALHFTFKGDSAVVNSLSGYRFPDKKMEVIVKDSANEIKPTKKPLKEVKATIEAPLSKLMKKIGDVLKEEINNEMNVYTFKTRSCRYADGCKAKDLCLKFHDAGDRRRCLLLHRYSDEMCSDLEESGSCEAKDKCSSAHSPLEILFHYKNFRSSICPGWQQNRACDKVGRVCSYVHPEKPEMLYNNKWDNLYVEGLKRTLNYLAEAVKNLFLVKGLQCLQVLLITVSPELAKLYVDCIRELAKCCKQKVSYSAGDTVEKGTTVLITTLNALRQLLNVNNPRQSKKLDTTRLKALILDDGPALLKNCPKFIQNYLADLTRKDVNVVITAAKISNKEVKDTQDKIHPSGVFKKIFVESLKKKDSKPCSSAKSGSYKIDVLERMIASTRSSDTKKTSEGQSSKNKTDKALESKSSSKEKTSTTVSSSRGSSSRSSSSKDSSSSSRNLDERIKTLAALEIQYQKALAEMDEEQKQELELYTSSPEFHPEFEQKYSIFMEQYNAHCPDRSDVEHANKLWGEFWKNLLTLQLQEEYNAKKQDLKNEYQDKKEKAYKGKGTLSQDSREKENKQDDTKQERRSSESQKRKSSTDNRDNHREKYRRDERSSDVGRRRMNQNRNEDSYKGRRQQYSRSEFSRDSLGRGHQYHGHEKSSRYGGMQQNSNKEEFNKGRTKKSSSVVGSKESSTDMQETIHILKKLCPSLGVVGSAAQLLMSKISICSCDRQELSKLVQDDDNKMILMMLLEKAQAMKLRLPSNHVLTLLNLASLPAEKPKYYGLNIENIAKMTYNMDPSYIVQCIKNALTAQGINNASEKDVSDIYAAVTSAHFDIACSKSGEGAQPKTQESRQGDSGSLKRVSSGWSDDDDDEGSRPFKRGEGSWSGRVLEVNSSNVTQGRQPGGRNELGGYGSGKQFGAGSNSSSNMEFSTLGNLSSLVENFNSQQGKSSGQQGNKEDLVGMMEFLSQL